MPSSILYDQSLVLGSIIDTRVTDLLKQISAVQSKADMAQEKMNSFVMMKRSLAMTMNELTDMGVDISALDDRIAQLDQSIAQSANEYLTTKLGSEEQIQQLKTQLYSLDNQADTTSPVDFTQTKVTVLPLASESIKIDVQYFSFGSNETNDVLVNIEKYVKESTSDLGAKSNEISNAVSNQVNRQVQNHNLSGTLIITASCTHRNVAMLNPLVLNLESAVSIWNSLYSDAADQIAIDNLGSSEDTNANTADAKTLTLLSGAAYGSSFVGMVHMLQTDVTDSNVDDETIAKLRSKLKLGGWLQNAAGGMGVDASTMNEVKRMLSTQRFGSHVSIVAMGTTPSIASGEIKLGLNKILQNESQKNLDFLTSLSQVESSEIETVSTDSNESRTAARLMQVQQSNSAAIVRELSEIDHGTNKTLDINSLMAAFDNYIETIRSSGNDSIGVPINFFFTKITRDQLIRKLAEKYKPADKTQETNQTSN